MSLATTAAAVTIGTSLYGASQMGKGGGARQAGTQTTTVAPPSYIANEYDILAGELSDLRQSGLLGAVQELSPFERSLIERGMERAEAGSPFQAAGERAVAGLLSGDGMLGEAADIYRGVAGQDTMSSPAFQAAAQRQVDKALRPLTSQFALGGRLGSGLMGAAAGEAAAEALSPMMFQAQQQDIANRMSAAQGLTGIAGEEARRTGLGLESAAAVSQMPFTDIQRGLGLGGLLSSEAFQKSQQPVRAFRELSDLTKGATVGEQRTQPLYSADNSGLEGAALMSIAPRLGQAFGQIGQGLGFGGGYQSSNIPTFGGTPTGAMTPENYLLSAGAG